MPRSARAGPRPLTGAGPRTLAGPRAGTEPGVRTDVVARPRSARITLNPDRRPGRGGTVAGEPEQPESSQKHFLPPMLTSTFIPFSRKLPPVADQACDLTPFTSMSPACSPNLPGSP